MRIEYEDEELRRLAEDHFFAQKKWGPDVVTAYRKKIQLIRAAVDERDLRAIRSLHLEQLSGDRNGQCSIRLNIKFRLILSFVTRGDRVAVVLELNNHYR
ncbi:type II toxin-antitoxin system RelE/ParE family toxin [Rothia endophytica]|uniref:type II toxin-antitoxin system RelE/ParE family toxin n=1 Tax=Rothia endophytica TaxID=1324766 RepID=UPI003CD09A84